MISSETPFSCGPNPKRGKEFRGENLFGSRVLLHNWYEDRRQYHQDCTRCTGHSIYRTDYLAHHAEDYLKKQCMPPSVYEIKLRNSGEGANFLRNNEDYCDYLQNYTTTYDLMHNWETRRAGCKAKPKRKWNLGADALWFPQPDNAVSFGNLTQLGFRQAPQLPMVPNDWHLYNMDTTNKRFFPEPRYPEAYVLCRYATPKCVARETSDMMLVRKPGMCDCCRFRIPKHPMANDACRYPCEDGKCMSFIPNTPRIHPSLIPARALKSKPGIQTLFATDHANYDERLKHIPRPVPIRGEPILESTCGHTYDNKEVCQEAEVAMKYNQGPYLPA